MNCSHEIFHKVLEINFLLLNQKSVHNATTQLDFPNYFSNEQIFVIFPTACALHFILLPSDKISRASNNDEPSKTVSINVVE